MYNNVKIAIGADHGGYELKQIVLEYLATKGCEFKDFGTFSRESVDYTDYAQLVCERIMAKDYNAGILICKTGIGMSIAANKFPGIRAAVVHNEYTAKMAREHNNANVLVFGADIITKENVGPVLDAFFNAEFQGGRHQNRLNKIRALEDKYCK